MTSILSCLLEFVGSDKFDENEDNGISGQEVVVSKELIISARLFSDPRFYFIFVE
jgi:hypothetical protein